MINFNFQLISDIIMNDCNKVERLVQCTCSYMTCSRRGKCCECIEHHLIDKKLPGCIFAKISEQAESSYDRSFEYFAKLVLKKCE